MKDLLELSVFTQDELAEIYAFVTVELRSGTVHNPNRLKDLQSIQYKVVRHR